MTKTTEPGTCSQAIPPARPISAAPNATTPVIGGYSKQQRRDDIVAMLRADLGTPAVYGSSMFTKYIPDYNPATVSPGYTTCGHFPQGVAKLWARDYYFKRDNRKFNLWWKNYVEADPRNFKFIRQGLEALRSGARPPTSWKQAKGKATAKPGDFYGLVEPVKTPKKGGDLVERHTRGTGFCHVGVVIARGKPRSATLDDRRFFTYEALTENGKLVLTSDGKEQYLGSLPDSTVAPMLAKITVEDWETADAGQGVGLTGQTCMLVKRLYQPDNDRMSGEKSQEPGDRWLEGWLNIDEFEHWPFFVAEVP